MVGACTGGLPDFSPNGATGSSLGRKPWVVRQTKRPALKGRQGNPLLRSRLAHDGVAPLGLGLFLRRGPRACALGYCLSPRWG
jgi:hypothetical protein